MRTKRALRVAIITVFALVLTACAGLPTDGAVNAGLEVGRVDTGLDVTFLPDGPSPDASPEEIVAGFLEAGTSPANRWEIARQFLSPELSESWTPAAGVTIDAPGAAREVSSVVEEPAEVATVEVTLTPVASVDAVGTYRDSTGGTAEAPYELARNDDGEWRITSAPDGIVLDEDSFTQVFRRYSLQYFDVDWQHLVPDPRWLPRGPTIATNITRALVGGSPSEWLAASVRTAFPTDVTLAVTSVPVTGQTADVTLSASAAAIDPVTLGRMRTQLERSLASAGVTEVRFLVDGRELDGEAADVVLNRIDPTTFVLTEDAFGPIVGSGVTEIAGVSGAVLGIGEPIAAIDLAGDALSAAVQTESGPIYRVREGRLDAVDSRPGLIAPTQDTNDFIWSVPAGLPEELVAWSPDGTPHPIVSAWTGASGISQLRIAPDGVRIAAVVSTSGQQWLALAAIVRNAEGIPVELGPVEPLRLLPGPARGLAWLGDDVVGVLVRDSETTQLLEATVGGPDTVSVVPADAVALAGANNVSGARLMTGSGVVLLKRGTTWQESFTGALLLGTQSGR